MTYWLTFVILFCAAYYFVTFRNLARKKQAAAEYLASHPDTARVYLQRGMRGLAYDVLTVLGVNDEEPHFFYEGLKQGLFLAPGTNVVEVIFSTQKPGILHKTVTTEYGASKQEVEVEAYKQYRLGFDRKEETYVFEEIG